MVLKGATLAKIETRYELVVFRAYGGLSTGNCYATELQIKEKIFKAIKYDKDPENSCQILPYVLKKFPNIFPLENDRLKILEECPRETDTFIKVTHKQWDSYFVFSYDASKIHNQKNGDIAKVLLFIPHEKITVKWDNYGEETFIYSSDRKAYFLEEKEEDKEEK